VEILNIPPLVAKLVGFAPTRRNQLHHHLKPFSFRGKRLFLIVKAMLLKRKDAGETVAVGGWRANFCELRMGLQRAFFLLRIIANRFSCKFRFLTVSLQS